MRSLFSIFVASAAVCATPALAAPSEASRLVALSEQQTVGDSFQGKMTMTVAKGDSKRTMVLRLWSKGHDLALVKLLSPPKERDQGNLRVKLDLWQYLPNIERLVEIPPSLMLQSWMGSDFSHDDLVKTSSLARDYTHELDAKENVGEVLAQKIICTPKPDAPVAWGKVHLWVRPKDGVPVRRAFFNENGQLVKVMEGSEIKQFGKHTIPTRLVMRNVKRPDDSTTLVYDEAVFDGPISSEFFSQQNLKKPVTH